MATAEQPAAPQIDRGVRPLRAGQGYSFIWRRLHSLLGIIPIGAFLIEHIVSNFEALKGPAAYAAQVKFLNGLPLVRVLEWTFIFIPLIYHGVYGVYIWLNGKSNVVYYPWAGNWMYVAQRWTGLIAFAYIIQHVLRQRFMGVDLPEHPGAAFAKVQHELSHPWMVAVYVIAMIAICWHFAYGIWLFAAKWGITPGETARKRFGWVCLALGVALAVMGLASIWAFIGPKYRNAPEDVALADASGLAATLSDSRGKTDAAAVSVPHAASVLFGQFETVLFAKADFLSSAPPFYGMEKASADNFRFPFAELSEGLKRVAGNNSDNILNESQAVLLGAKEFLPPAGLGGVHSRRCYVLIIDGERTRDISGYFRSAALESTAGIRIWKWSAQLGEFGEEDPARPTNFFAAPVDSSYLLIANNRDDLQNVASGLAGPDDSKAILAGVPDWKEASRYRIWGYRHLGDSRVLQTDAEGMSLLTINAKTLLFFVDSEKKECVLRIVSSDMGRNSALTEAAARMLPPLEHQGNGIWEVRFPFPENEEGHQRLFLLSYLFGFGVYV